MEPVNTVDPGELAPLRQLASEFLAADAVEVGVLERLASLATELAAKSREQARLKLVDLVEARALPLLPAAADGLRSRLSPLSLDELSGLSALLERAVTARAAFEEADSGLMAARRRGDYAAMAPLALEADAQKTALENATIGFAERLGLGSVLEEQAPAVDARPAEPDPQPVVAEAVGDPAAAEGPPLEASADDTAPAAAAEAPVDLAARVEVEPAENPSPESEPAEAQPERRRLRALIRQMRPTSDEAPATR
jgi:hypothetical protein